MMRHDLIDQLIGFCKENFQCERGSPQAYFEFPHPEKDGEIVRVDFVTYIINAQTAHGAAEWMLENVLKPLVEKAGPNPRLYWRLEEKFRLSAYANQRFDLYTRIGVMTKGFEPVEIEDMLRREGERTPLLDPRLEPV